MEREEEEAKGFYARERSNEMERKEKRKSYKCGKTRRVEKSREEK